MQKLQLITQNNMNSKLRLSANTDESQQINVFKFSTEKGVHGKGASTDRAATMNANE